MTTGNGLAMWLQYRPMQLCVIQFPIIILPYMVTEKQAIVGKVFNRNVNRVICTSCDRVAIYTEGREQGLSFFTLTFSNKNAPDEEGGLGSFQTSL